MLLRALGMLVLFGVSLCLCRTVSRVERGRVRQAEGFLLLLRHIRTQIACFRTPVGEIYAGFENRALASCGFLAALRRDGFAAALRECRPGLYLGSEELALLAAFGDEVGKSYCEEQLALCDYTVGELESLFTKRRDEESGRTRVAHSLVITGSLMLILILL